ncbi:MAG: gfo/Idh/MocA family oxidoreductase, partial [Bacteroidota bacterium]|nr:gfo/Idh/MocA family oxidoreductase [Bacteroidota bacterium]
FDLGEGKGKKQILFDRPEVHPINAIQKELESFYEAITDDVTPPVTIFDGYHALDIAYRIMEELQSSTNNQN